MDDDKVNNNKKRPHDDDDNDMDVDDDDDDDKPSPFTRLNVYGEHKRAVSAVSFAPGRTTRNLGRPLCASASADGSVKIWDLTKKCEEAAQQQQEGRGRTSSTITSLEPHEPPQQDNDDGGDNNKSNKQQETEKKSSNSKQQKQQQQESLLDVGQLLSPIQTLMGHSRGINDVAWSNTGSHSSYSCTNYVATASDDKTLRLWDATTSEALVEFRGHSNFVFCCKFNPQSSNLLVSGSFDETVKLWDVRTGDCVSTLPAHSDPVTAVDFNRDGTCIVSGSHDGLIRIWDTATGECLKTIYAHGNPPVSHVQYSPNGKYVLAGTLDSKLRLWHMTSKTHDVSSAKKDDGDGQNNNANNSGGGGGKCTKTYACPEYHSNTKYCIVSDFVVSNPKRQCIVTGSETGKLILYDINTRSVQQVLSSHTDSVLAVSSHDTQELIVSGGMTLDRTVQFWQPKPQSQLSSSINAGDYILPSGVNSSSSGSGSSKQTQLPKKHKQ